MDGVHAHRLQRWLRQLGPAEAFGGLADLVTELSSGEAAVFAVDADRNIIFWNSGAEALLGFTEAEMLGQHCLKGNRCQNCMAGCGIQAHGKIAGVPLEYIDAHDKPVQIFKTARAFFDAQGVFLGGIEVLSPRKEAARAADGGAPPTALSPPGGQVSDLMKGFSHERFHGLITCDPKMLQAFQVIRNVAETDATVLIRGESGTGKELVARALHEESHRRDKAFRAINCAALSPHLLESEIFGHVKGAFTGAHKDRKGMFELADGGTLFLDEVAELPLELQAKLLRVLQDQTFSPVGSGRELKVDVRILAATHQPLRERAASGSFREDLMYRLRVVPIYLAPLRDRRGDVELLLRHFVDIHNGRGPRRVHTINPDALRLLLNHPWNGNVRELINVVQYVFAVGRGGTLAVSDLPPEFLEVRGEGMATRSVGGALGHKPEDVRILEALEEAEGNVGRAAELMGMSRPTFWRKRKKHGI